MLGTRSASCPGMMTTSVVDIPALSQLLRNGRVTGQLLIRTAPGGLSSIVYNVSLTTRTAIDRVRILGALVRSYTGNFPSRHRRFLELRGCANDEVEDQDERVLARSPSLSRSTFH